MTDSKPALSIVNGNPTDEEIAVVLAVVSSLGSDSEESATSQPQWGAPARMHRSAAHHGPTGTWWHSGLPS